MDTTNGPVMYLDYTGPMGDRVTGYRFAAGTTANQAFIIWQDNLATAMKALMSNQVDFVSARWKPQGADFSVPIPTSGPIGSGTNAGTLNTDRHAGSFGVVARSLTTGKRTRNFLYGVPITPQADYRFEPGEAAVVDAYIAAFVNFAAAGGFRAVDGTVVTLNNYVNYRVNGYWQRQYRRTR